MIFGHTHDYEAVAVDHSGGGAQSELRRRGAGGNGPGEYRSSATTQISPVEGTG